MEVVEDRRVPAAFAGISADAFSPDNGGTRGKIVDASSGEDIAEIEAYEASVRGDVTGNGVRDLITGTGGSGGPLPANRHSICSSYQART